ncbi:hypothetical protein Q361_1382, partial [Flavobacterium croceum DSM 17960]
MRNNYFLRWTQRMMFLFTLLCGLSMAAQSSFSISFPSFSSAPTANPRNLVVCNSFSKLQVQLDVTTASTTGASVTIQLGAGVEYVPGSVAVVSTNAGLTIVDDGGTPNAPKFKVGPNALALANRLVFTIDRKATCATRTAALAGTAFKDTVTGSITGATATTEVSSTYSVTYPVFSFSQPATQTNAGVGSTYSRTFTITNGGNGPATAVYFAIDYASTGAQAVSVTLTGGTGSSGTPVVLTPTSTSGTISYYAIPAANLTGGDLGFGETLVVTEQYKLLKCNAVTNYSAGWGCDAAPANWCQTVTGTGNVTMATGSATYNVHTTTILNFVDMCTPFAIRNAYTNSGTGATAAATMYDVILRKGNAYNDATALSGLQTLYNLSTVYVRNVAAGTNSAAIPYTYTTSGRIHTIDLNNYFTTDPDGAGVGLEDVDGDGFYDDLPPGNTVVTEIDIAVDCPATWTCANNSLTQDSVGGDIKYHTMCDKSTYVTPLSRSGGDALNHRKISLVPTGYIPANVNPGTPFDVNIGISYYDMYNYLNRTGNTKYEYQITVPTGTTVTAAKWANGKYNLSTALNTVTFTQVGNLVTIVSPINATATSGWGWVKLTMTYDCSGGSNFVINWKLLERNNVNTGCNCRAEQVCGTLTALAACAAPYAAGPSTSIPVVRRADNSLGWTDYTLTTRQSASSISAYDLSKALYLDEIEISANATQNNAASNLYIYLELPKASGNTSKLTPISVDVVVKRGGTSIATGNLTSFSQTESTTTKQIVTWDLTSLIPSGGLLAGDIVETKSHYTVATNNLPNNDVQSGTNWYFYNLNGTTKESCNNFIPEMYLVGTAYRNGASAGPVPAACTALSPYGGHFIARGFDDAGLNYTNEFRPVGYITKYEITIPTGYELVSCSYTPLLGGASVAMTPTSVSGNTYVYDNPGTWVAYRLSATAPQYGAYIRPIVQPTCGAPSNTQPFATKTYYKDYYYHYATDVVQPTTWDVIHNLNISSTYNQTTAPKITLTNQTGIVQASKPTESFTIRMASVGGSPAPYRWLSVPTVAGVTPIQLVDLSTNTVIMPITYAGGVWFQLGTAGQAINTDKDYRLDFSYTTCNTTTFAVEGGWNCSAYPTDPSAYTCGTADVTLPFIPQTAEVQIKTEAQPTSDINLCTNLYYEYRINSAGAGNTVDNTFTIDLPAGMSIVAGSLQAQYPVGTGSWETVSTSTAGTQTTLDLTTHTAFPAQGLPGTLTDGGVANSRLMGIRFNVVTDCNFIAGSNLTLSAGANRSCGAPATGDGVGSASLSVK